MTFKRMCLTMGAKGFKVCIAVLLAFGVSFFCLSQGAELSVKKWRIREIKNNISVMAYQYDSEIDLRVIIMVYNRPESLLKCLQSVQNLKLDGDSASLDIWVDRGKDNLIHNATVHTAEKFVWRSGRTKVHIQGKHAGIYGQWIDTWRPRENTKELTIFLEDDVDLSPYAYIWLKAANKKYGHLADIAGYALFEGGLVNMRNPPDPIFLHSRLGSQGFAPTAYHWRHFQDWFHSKSNDKTFHPYVKNDPTITGWYKGFENSHKEKGMWTIWFIRYCDDHSLWTLYPNYASNSQAKGSSNIKGQYFAYHRQENGLHFKGKGRSNQGKLIDSWQENFISWPKKVNKYFYKGQHVGSV